MPIGAIITLALVGVALIVFAIILIVRGGKIKFPDGDRYTYTEGTMKLHLIISKNVRYTKDRWQLARFCHKVHVAIRAEFTEDGLYNADVFNKCREFAVHFLTDDEFNQSMGKKYIEYAKHAAAYITRCGKYFWGTPIPRAVIREQCIDIMILSGEPLIHEACHAYLDDYIADSTDHSDKRVWIAAGGFETTAQGRAKLAILDFAKTYNEGL